MGWWCLHGESKLQNFEIVVWKTNTSPQISIYYWLSSFYHHWYMKYKSWSFLTQFWVNYVTAGFKTAIFWASDLRNQLLTSKFLQILISIFLSPSIHGIQLWALFTQSGDNDATKEINITEFWKVNSRIGFGLSKIQMPGSAKVSIVVWSRHVALKLFWRTLENDVIKGSLFHTFHQTFYKKFSKFSVLKQVFSIYTNFNNDWLKTRYKPCIST